MIQMAPGHILDEFGNPIRKTQQARQELVEAFVSANGSARAQKAHYDAAQTTDEYKNHWASADAYDADSANSYAVRTTLVQRSRYEVWNNGYADGIASTYANDLIGTGPTLRMQTGSEGFNRMVEAAWHSWCKATHLRRKLWTMAHAKHTDGEAFGVVRQNRRLRHPIKLDVVLIETEMCHTPYLPWGEPGYIDGIKFDEFGNPVWYDILKTHPGSTYDHRYEYEPERVPAQFVLHWYKTRRPGQHRGIPESASTLNLGAASRRWRESTLAAADNIANFSLFLETMFEPDQMDSVSAMSTLEIQRRMMTALPQGWKAFQPKAEQPTSSYEQFSKALISEQARPKNMPLNKAACDSSSYNYASGRLDHSTYYGSLNIDRADCDDMVCDKLFDAWFDAAVLRYGWLGGNPESISDSAKMHAWDWPKHHVADIQAEAGAIKTNLETGATDWHRVMSESGLDPEDELVKQAMFYGVTAEQMRTVALIRNLPQHVIPYAVELVSRGELLPEPEPRQAVVPVEQDETENADVG